MQTHQSPNTQPERLLRLDEVIHMVGMKKTGIYDAVKANKFPQPVKLSRRSVCWPLSSINTWISERIKAGGK